MAGVGAADRIAQRRGGGGACVADLGGRGLVAAGPAATAQVADALVPVGGRGQPDLDADAGRGGRRIRRAWIARADHDFDQAHVLGGLGGRGRGRRTRQGQRVALLEGPGEDDLGVRVRFESRLHAVIATERGRRRGRGGWIVAAATGAQRGQQARGPGARRQAGKRTREGDECCFRRAMMISSVGSRAAVFLRVEPQADEFLCMIVLVFVVRS